MNEKATILPQHSGNQGTPASSGFSTCSVHLGCCGACLFVLYCYVLVFFLLYFLMCSLHFLESSGRTVVTARRWHRAGSVMFQWAFLVQVDPWSSCGSLVKEAGQDVVLLSKLHRLTARLLPPSFTPTSPFTCQSGWPIEFSREARPSLRLLFGWIGVRGRRLLLWKLATLEWQPPTPPLCFANHSAGCKNRSVGSIWQVGRWPS